MSTSLLYHAFCVRTYDHVRTEYRDGAVYECSATSDSVARALGHTSFAMTAKHYASADSVVNSRVTRAAQLLAPKTSEPQPEEIDAFIARLSPTQREDLRVRLAA